MRFVTYNIRRGLGADSAISLRRVGAVLAAQQADVVGLNEVWSVPLINDQPQRLARQLGMESVFQSNVTGPLSAYGNLALTRGSVITHVDLKLPSGREQRGALFLETEIDGHAIVFVTTHLGLTRARRTAQIARLRAELPEGVPLVVTGDFNAGIEELDPLLDVLHVAPPQLTYPSTRPRSTLDYVLYSGHWKLEAYSTVQTLASDHLPVVVDLVLDHSAI